MTPKDTREYLDTPNDRLVQVADEDMEGDGEDEEKDSANRPMLEIAMTIRVPPPGPTEGRPPVALMQAEGKTPVYVQGIHLDIIRNMVLHYKQKEREAATELKAFQAKPAQDTPEFKEESLRVNKAFMKMQERVIAVDHCLQHALRQTSAWSKMKGNNEDQIKITIFSPSGFASHRVIEDANWCTVFGFEVSASVPEPSGQN